MKKAYGLCLVLFILGIVEGFSASSTEKNNNQDKDKKFTVVLDAGHGGKDPGRPTSYGFTEKEIALEIVLQVGKLLEANKNINVVYTRKTDVFLGLKERAAIANKADADLFVSVHCNAHHTQAYGAETYVLGLHKSDANFNVAKEENEVIFLEENYEEHYEGFNPSSPESLIGLTLLQEEYLDQSILLAKKIQDNFTHTLKRRNRGVKQAGFWVLHNTYMPSVLIETGFITHRKEGFYLNSKKGQREVSTEIYKAILSYAKALGIDEVYAENTSQKNNTDRIYPSVEFSVQLAASSKAIELKAYNFKGLKGVHRQKEGSLYRYFYGKTSNYTEIQQQLKAAKDSGYTDAYIVAFKDGTKISVKDALKTKAK